MKLSAHPVKTGQARLGLPGDVDMITGSALTPVLESVTALPAPAYRQEGGASSRLARESRGLTGWFSPSHPCVIQLDIRKRSEDVSFDPRVCFFEALDQVLHFSSFCLSGTRAATG